MEKLTNTPNTKTIKISEDVFNTTPAKSRKNKTIKRSRKPVIDTAELHAKLINNINRRNTMVNNRPQIGGNLETPKIPSIQASPEPPSLVTPPPKEPQPTVKEPAKSEYEESLTFMSAIKEPPRKYRKPRLPLSDTQDNILNTSNSDPVDNSQHIKATLTYKIDKDIPHGCLKNGLKKTLKNIHPSVGVSQKHVTFEPSIGPPTDDGRLTIEPMHPEPPSTPSNGSIPLDTANKENSDYLRAIVIPDEDESKVSVDTTKDEPEDTKKIQMNKDDTPNEPVDPDHMLPIDPATTPAVYTDVANSQNNKITSRGGTRRYKVKKTFRLGRHPTKKIVSIFCKNLEMINGIKKIQSTLKNISISDMKRYLVRKSLMNIGSTAPNDIIKQMYVSAITSGNIQNKNSKVLLDVYN